MKEHTAEQIIEVGLELYSGKGFNNVGLQEILNTAGVPKGSFYYYFKSKDDFGLKVIKYYSTQSLSILTQYLGNKKKTPRERIISFYTDMRNVYQSKEFKEGCLMGNCSADLADIKSNFAQLLSNEFEIWQNELETCISEGILDGSITTQRESQKLAAFILNNWEGALIRMKADKSSYSMDVFVEFLEDLL